MQVSHPLFDELELTLLFGILVNILLHYQFRFATMVNRNFS